MKLNENIRNFRRFRNMSQAELAAQLSKSKSVISHWESGENSPDLDSCEKLCRILKVTPNQLFGWEENREYTRWLQEQQSIREHIDKMTKEKQDLEFQIAAYTAKLTQLSKDNDDGECTEAPKRSISNKSNKGN